MSDTTSNNKPKTTLDDQIDRVLAYLAGVEVGSEEYTKTADQLDALYKMRGHKKSSSSKPSADAMFAAGASILGIIIIVAYEHGHVIGSKALGFVSKAKV